MKINTDNIAIVTGAGGYIGSVLCRLLKEQNKYFVVAVENKLTNYKKLLEKDNIDDSIYSCFSSPQVLDYIRKNKNKKITVFHLAANSLLGPSYSMPLEYYRNNACKVMNLLEVLPNNSNFIFASTAAVYKNNNEVKTEQSEIDPPNVYGSSKLFAEKIIESFTRVNNIRSMSFRFFNVIGAYTGVCLYNDLPQVTNQLYYHVAYGKPFKVFGNDYNTHDGTCIRDYVHVVDVCRAMIHANEYMLQNDSHKYAVYNLGTGKGFSVLELINTFELVTGKKVDYEIAERRIGDPDYLVADGSAYTKNTGFEYKYSDSLKYMLLTFWNYRKFFGG